MRFILNQLGESICNFIKDRDCSFTAAIGCSILGFTFFDNYNYPYFLLRMGLGILLISAALATWIDRCDN